MHNSLVDNMKVQPLEGATSESPPFVLGFVSNLAGHASSCSRGIDRITKHNFAEYFASVAPKLHLPGIASIQGEYQPAEVQLDFRSIADFEMPGLRELLSQREASNQQIDILMNSIMHHPDFMQLETSWRNLRLLVEKYAAESNAQILVGCCCKSSLSRDVASEITKWFERKTDQHSTWPHFTAVLFEFEFSHRPNDLQILEHLGTFGAEHRTTILCPAAPRLFGLDSWSDLPIPREMTTILDGNEYREWNEFRKSEAAKWIYMTVSSVLSRVPNAMEWELQQSEPFSHSSLCWTNSATCLAAVLLEQHKKRRYLEILGGTKNASLESLSSFSQQLKSGETVRVGPTDISISNARIKELESLGLNPLVRHSEPSTAFFPHLVCLADARETGRNHEQEHYLSSKHWKSITVRMLTHRMEYLGLEPTDIEYVLDQPSSEAQETLAVPNRPFVIGVVADLASSRVDNPFRYRDFIEVSSKSLDKFTEYLQPTIQHPRQTAIWKNLTSLIDNSSRSGNVKIRVLPCTAHELIKDIRRAVEFRHTCIYKKVCQHQLHSFEGEPFGMLIVDLMIEHSEDNKVVFQQISKMCEDANVMLVVNSKSEFTNW